MHNSLYELTSGILESITENIFIIDINRSTFEMNQILIKKILLKK